MEQFLPGCLLHPIHGRMLASTPRRWRPASITAVDGQGAVADYVLDDGTVTLWHHTALSTQVAVGDPVRVHEEHHGLEMEEFRP